MTKIAIRQIPQNESFLKQLKDEEQTIHGGFRSAFSVEGLSLLDTPFFPRVVRFETLFFGEAFR